MKVVLLAILLFLALMPINIFAELLFDLNCSSSFKNENSYNITDVTILLATPGEENPYGPVRGLPATLNISFVSKVDKDDLERMDSIYGNINAGCLRSNGERGGGVTGRAMLDHDIIADYGQFKLVRFYYSSYFFVPSDAEYCHIYNFYIFGRGFDRNSGQECERAPIDTMSGFESEFHKTFYPIDISIYDSWRSSEQQNIINILLFGVGFLSAVAAVVSAYTSWKSAELQKIEVNRLLDLDSKSKKGKKK